MEIVRTEGPGGPWRAASHGTGARPWFVASDFSGHRPMDERYHFGPSGDLIRFASYEAAQVRADQLNAD